MLFSDMVRSNLHFKNGLLCKTHKHGASCSVDTLLEIFKSCLYDNDPTLSEVNNNNLLLDALVNTCQARAAFGARCEIREGVWDVLVRHIPKAFWPKGRQNAEIIEAFHYLTRNASEKFSVLRSTLLGCTVCGDNVRIRSMTNPILYYTQQTNLCCPGNFAAGIISTLELDINHQLQQMQLCTFGHPRIYINHTSHMPKFLMISLGLSGPHARNEQQPELVIPEAMLLHKDSYTLVGAVQMGPAGDHFVAIVGQRNGMFRVIDDLKDAMEDYPTFASAIYRKQIMTRHARLTPDHAGVHMLFYVKTERPAPSGRAAASAEPARVSGSTTCSSADTNAKAHKRGITAASGRAAEPARVSGSTTCSSADTNPKAHKRGGTAASGRAAEPARVSGSTTCSSADTNPKAASHGPGGTAAIGRAAASAAPASDASSAGPGSSSPTCSSADKACAGGDGAKRKMSTAPTTVKSKVQKTCRKPDSSTCSTDVTRDDPKKINAKIDSVARRIMSEPNDMAVLEICGNSIPYGTHEGHIYISCKELFSFLGLTSCIRNKGYGKFISVLPTSICLFGKAFIFKKLGSYWVRRDCLLVFLRNTNVYPTSNRKKVVVLDEMKRHFRKFTKIQRQCDTSLNSHCHDADTSHLNNSEQSVFDESLQISKHTHSCPSVLPRASTPDLKDSSVGVDGAAPYNGISPAECTGTKDMTMNKSDLDISSVSVIGESSLCESSPVETDKNKSVPAVLNTSDADRISVLSQSVGYVIKNGKLFLEIAPLFIECGWQDSVKKNGFRRFDSVLVNAGFPDISAIFIISERKVRTHIWVLAFLKLLDNCRAGDMDIKAKLHFEILQVMEHLLVNGNLPKTRKVNNNRGDIPTIVKDFYSNKKDLFLQDLSKYIGKDSGNFCLTKDDIQLFLNYSKTKSKRKTIIECIQQCYREAFPVSPEQTLLFISETFTGEKLRNELRKLLPGILPSDSCERVAKRELKESFNACCLPQRSSTGWHIAPERLFQVLSFRYPFLKDHVYLRTNSSLNSPMATKCCTKLEVA